MAEIVSLTKFRPHKAGPVVCLSCGDNWWVIRPVGTAALECPNCGSMTGYDLAGMLKIVETRIGEKFADCLATAIVIEQDTPI